MSNIQDNLAVYDRFLQFRANVIQAIALAWKDPEFEKQFMEDPKKAFEEVFNYSCTFDIEIETEPNNAEWNGLFAGEWETKALETLTMILPPKPPVEEESLALANYNANHLTFLN